MEELSTFGSLLVRLSAAQLEELQPNIAAVRAQLFSVFHGKDRSFLMQVEARLCEKIKVRYLLFVVLSRLTRSSYVRSMRRCYRWCLVLQRFFDDPAKSCI